MSDAGPSSPRSRPKLPLSSRNDALSFTWISLACFAALAVQYVLYELPLIGIDDANIFFAYARNLAHGNGFVLHPGTAPVEGVSSLLYTLVCAAGFMITPSPEVALQVLNAIFCALALLILVRMLDVLAVADDALVAPRQHLGLAGWYLIVWSVASPSFMTWTESALMENALWSLLLIAALSQVVRQAFEGARGSPGRTRWFAIILVGLILTRPEAMVLAPAYVFAWFGATLHSFRSWRPALAATAVPACVVFLTLMAVTVFRMAYFGYPLPNTYYAKVSPDMAYRLREGTAYLWQFVQSSWLLLPIVVTSAVGLVIGLRRNWGPSARTRTKEGGERDTAFVAFLVSAFIAASGALCVVHNGGDHFPLFRIFQSFWPIIGIVPVFLVAAIWPGSRRWMLRPVTGVQRLVLPVMAIALYVSNVPPWHRPDTGMARSFKWAQEGRRRGETLNGIAEGAGYFEVGITLLGGFAFQYDGPTIDLLGLTNVEMGHSEGARQGPHGHAAFNKDVFWALAPDIVEPQFLHDVDMLDVDKMRFNESLNSMLQGLLRGRRFQHEYAPCLVTAPEGPILADPWFFYPHLLPRALGHRLPRHRSSGLAMFCRKAVIDRIEAAGYRVRRLASAP